jgi:hypothetical protein
LQASCARVLSLSLKELKPHRSKRMNNNAAKNPPYNHDLLVHKEFSRTKHKRKHSARVLRLSLSLNNTLCLEIPLSKCELLQQRLAHTPQRLAERSTGQAFSFFSSRCKGRVQKVREGRRGGWGGRGVSNVLCCERKERYVERLCY